MFETWITELADLEVDGRGRRALCDLAADAARLRAALDGLEARIGAAVDGLDDGGAGASTVYRAAGRCSQREADRRARRAAALRALPGAAEALTLGEVSAEHVDQLVRAAEAVSADEVERSDLVERARSRPADLLARDVREFTRRRQRAEQLEARQARLRSARRCVVFDNDDGMTVVHAELDPVRGAEVRAALGAVVDRMFRDDGGRDGAAEVRTAEQRRADGLVELLTKGDSARGASSAVRHQVLVIAHADGSAEIPGVGPIPASELDRLSCRSELFGLVFSTAGAPLWHGRGRRLADDNQWRAVIARDGGCIGCGLGPAHCEAHHVVWWQAPGNGATDVDNLVLLCAHHHRLVHEHGWRVVRDADGRFTLRPP